MVAQMLQRRGLASEWSTVNPILADGEIGIDKTNNAIKIGDGVTRWNDLKFSYILSSQIQDKGDLLVGTGPGSSARLPRGTAGQTLSVDAAGNLVWIDPINSADYVPTGSAQTLYETIDEAIAAHSAMISSTDMANTYESISASNATHSLFETFTHSAATYATKSASDPLYRPKAILGLKTATSSSINSTARVWPSELQFNVEANSVYIFEAVLFYYATQVGGMDITVDCPLSASVRFGVHAPPFNNFSTNAQFGPSNHAFVTSYYSPNTMVSLGGGGAADLLFATIKGISRATTYSGQCRIGFNQTVATADTGAQIVVPSYIRARRVS